MGVTLKEQGRLESAVDAFKKSVAIKPDSHQSYNNMGNIFHDLGQFSESLHAYKKAISLFKNDVTTCSFTAFKTAGIAPPVFPAA